MATPSELRPVGEHDSAEARKLQKMRLARQVYYDLGPDRSIPKLRNALKERAAAGLETASRHNQTLTDWRRDYHWDEWCMRQQEIDLEADLARTRKVRERTSDALTLLLDDSVATLGHIMTSRTVLAKDRLKAIEMLYKALNIGVVQVTSEEVKDELPPMPGPDATPEEKTAWLASLQS